LPAGPSQPQPLYSMASWSIPALIPRDSPREPPSASRAPRSARPARTFSSLSLSLSPGAHLLLSLSLTLARRAPSPLSLSLDRCAPYPLSLSRPARTFSALSRPGSGRPVRTFSCGAWRGGGAGGRAALEWSLILQHAAWWRRGGVTTGRGVVASLRVAAWWRHYGWRRGGVAAETPRLSTETRAGAAARLAVACLPPRVWL
jgi:hypothetical protein